MPRKIGQVYAHPNSLRLEALTAFYGGESCDRISKRLGIAGASIPQWRKKYPELDAKARAAAECIKSETAAKAREAVAVTVANREAEMALVRERNDFVLPQMPQRDREVCVAFVEGGTLSEIGDRHGITRERVRQIVLRWRVRGLTLPSEREKPLTDSQMKLVTKHVPGRRRGRPKGPPKQPPETAWMGMIGMDWAAPPPKKPKRKVSHTPEHRAWLSQHMREVGLKRRGTGKRQLAAKEPS